MSRYTKHTPDNFPYVEYQLAKDVDEYDVVAGLGKIEDILYAPDGTERISLDLLRDITKTVDTVGVDRLREIVEADADGRCVVLLPDGQIYYIEEIKETGERWIGNRPCQYITGDGYHSARAREIPRTSLRKPKVKFTTTIAFGGGATFTKAKKAQRLNIQNSASKTI